MATIKAGHKLGLLKAASADREIVDTTVMLKAVAHPTDSRLLEKLRKHLVKLAEDNGLMLRQNDNRGAPRIVMQIGRYALHAMIKRRSANRSSSSIGGGFQAIGPKRTIRARSTSIDAWNARDHLLPQAMETGMCLTAPSRKSACLRT